MPGIHASPLYVPPALGAVLHFNDAVVSGSRWAGYRLESDGSITYRISTSGGYSFVAGAWLEPPIGMADFEVFATVTDAGDSGSMATSSPFDAWLSMDSDRFWELGQVPALEFSYATLEISIREASDPGTILGTSTIRLNVS